MIRRLLLTAALTGAFLFHAQPASATIVLNAVDFFWVSVYEDGVLSGYELEVEVGGTEIDGGTVETPDGTLLTVFDSAADSPLVDQTTFDASYGSGLYDFVLSGTTGDSLTFSITATRPTAPTGIVDIDSPLEGSTTGASPFIQWSCSTCVGDRLELYVVDEVLDDDVWEGPMSNVPGVGDARNGSTTVGPLGAGLYAFENDLFNFVQTNSLPVSTVEQGSVGIFFQESYSNYNVVKFHVPEPALASLIGVSLLGLLAARRRG